MVNDAHDDEIKRGILVNGIPCGTATRYNDPFSLARTNGISSDLTATRRLAHPVHKFHK